MNPFRSSRSNGQNLPTSMPEYSCSTADEALAIVEGQDLSPMVVFEAKWASTMDSNTPLSNKALEDIRKDMRKTRDQMPTEQTGGLRYDKGKDVVYAGHKFKFNSIEAATEFYNESRDNTKFDSELLGIRGLHVLLDGMRATLDADIAKTPKH